MANLIDTSISGIKTYENSPATLQLVYNENAIKNALKLWITSYKGDIVKRPNAGGYVTRWLFKQMNDITKQSIYTSILEGIAIDFNNELQVKSLSVVPNYQKRTWELSLIVYSTKYKFETTLSINLQG
jgi:hypothetical protein